MKKVLLVVLPILLTAQACNFLLGDVTGGGGSGSRGVFLSTDSGSSWEEMNTVVPKKTLANAQVTRLVFMPDETRNILAVTFNAGVFASNSGGEKWFALLPDFAGYDAFISPQKREIFAAGSRKGLAAILKSSDEGGTWVQVYTEPAGKAAVTSLISDPRSSAILYAGLSSGTILKSIDSGNNWKSLVNFQDRIVRLAISPDGNNFFSLSRTGGLRRSQDGGKTWVVSEMPESPGQFNDLFVSTAGGSTDLYVATNKGVYKSSDPGITWTRFLLPADPQVNNVSSVAVNPKKASQIFAAIRSTIYRSNDSGTTWDPQILLTGRTVNQILIDPSEPNRIYVGLK